MIGHIVIHGSTDSSAIPNAWRVGAGPPRAVHERQEHREEQDDECFRYTLGQKDDAQSGAQPQAAERAPQRERTPVVRHREPRERRHLGDHLVASQHEAETADEQRSGQRAVLPATVQLARGEGEEKKCESNVEGRREPRAVVQRQQWRKCTCAERRRQVVERRLPEEGFTGERRCDPRAAAQHVVDDAEGVGLVGFPRIVCDQTGQEPREAQQSEQGMMPRHHEGLQQAAGSRG